MSGILLYNRAVAVAVSATWRAQPDFRGTFGILSTCLGTLTICVWSAVHADIPSTKSRLWGFLNKMGWLAVGLLALELLLFIAYNQRLAAKKILQRARERLDLPPPPSPWYRRLFCRDDSIQPRDTEKKDRPSARKHSWGMTHAFYACMCGYAFDLASNAVPNQKSFLGDGSTRAFLTSHGIQFLLEYHPDLMPDISEDSIEDRSKADSMAKTILLGQVLWFCINCISRGGQGLPLSLLEVSTVAHAICTLFTYVMWWEKPLNVSVPTIIDGSGAMEACALMAMCSAHEKYILSGVFCFSSKAEMSCVKLQPSLSALSDMTVPSSPAMATPTHEPTVTPSTSLSDISISSAVPEYPGTLSSPMSSSFSQISAASRAESYIVTRPGLPIRDADFIVDDVAPEAQRRTSLLRALDYLKTRVEFGPKPWPWYVRSQTPSSEVVLRQEDLARWSLASSALQQYGIRCLNFLSPPYPQHFHTLVKNDPGLQAYANSDMYDFSGVLRPALAAAFLSAVYGLPHFIGWNSAFPTSVEHILWRASTITLTGFGSAVGSVAAIIIWLLQAVLARTRSNTSLSRPGEKQLLALAAVMYISSSTFLAVESFRQLLYLPPEVYDLPSWSNYWPHFA